MHRRENATCDPVVIETALKGLCIPMQIIDADAIITTYFASFFEGLENFGCGSFPDSNPKKCVRLLGARLEPPALKLEMRRRSEYDETLDKSVRHSIKVLIKEAIKCQTYGGTKTEPDDPAKTRTRSPKDPKKISER